MKAIFADTFYWIALSDPADARYPDALAVESTLADTVILTTEEVLSEFLTFFAGNTAWRFRAVRAVQVLGQAPNVQIVRQSHDSFVAGLELYESRLDKRYSLVDCISMQLMKREGIEAVLSNYRHFEQEGFQAVFQHR